MKGECVSNQALASVEIFVSYVGKGAPSNAAGARRGYGLTEAQAHKRAAHWANQAPYKRARRITVSDVADVSKHGLQAVDWEKIAWDVCGIPGEYETTERERECAELIRKGRYATAIFRALNLHENREVRL